MSAEEDPHGARDNANRDAQHGQSAAKELAFLKKLTFAGKRPTVLYYHRELQSLRDPLHFS
jgi:hypothetical protein